MKSLGKEGFQKMAKRFLWVFFFSNTNLHQKMLLCYEKTEVKLAVFFLSFHLFLSFFPGAFISPTPKHHSLPNHTCSLLLKLSRECTTERRKGRLKQEGEGGVEGRERPSWGEWSMQKRYNLQSGKENGPRQWCTTWNRHSIQRHTHTHATEDRNCFLRHFFYLNLSVFFVLSGMRTRESKNQQLKLGVILYPAESQ